MNFDDLPYREPFPNKKSRKSLRNATCKRRPPPARVRPPSYMESVTSSFLDRMGVAYYREHIFNGCSSVINEHVPLPFDFYLPEFCAVLELDGKQHFGKMDNDKHDYDYDKRILNDKTRDLYCVQNGIKLLRIPYTEFRNYRVLIRKFLNI